MHALLTTIVSGLALGLFAGGAALDKPPTSELPKPKLDGSYTIVSGEEDGKAIPAERVKGSEVKFAGDTVVGTDKDKKQFFAASFKLNTDTSPWIIDMTSKLPKEMKSVGLIKKDGDTVTIIYALPGGAVPKEFKTKEKQQMFVLKAVPVDPSKLQPAQP